MSEMYDRLCQTQLPSAPAPQNGTLRGDDIFDGTFDDLIRHHAGLNIPCGDGDRPNNLEVHCQALQTSPLLYSVNLKLKDLRSVPPTLYPRSRTYCIFQVRPLLCAPFGSPIQACSKFVYFFWSRKRTTADSNDVDAAPYSRSMEVVVVNSPPQADFRHDRFREVYTAYMEVPRKLWTDFIVKQTTSSLQKLRVHPLR